MADRSDYPAFAAGCWTPLLRAAYPLVQDWAAAEDLTQAALVKAWLAWPRLDDDPEAYVRKIIVITARIRRARMKRAAGAGLLAIAVAAGVVSGVTLAHEHAAVISYSGSPLPASFTAADGAAYRQLPSPR